MIRLPHQNLPKKAQNQLNVWQNEINCLEDYAERVAQGKKAFARRNKLTNSTFRQVRQTLTHMCCGARRCGYCEDSVADEVEHIKPKALYPETVQHPTIWKEMQRQQQFISKFKELFDLAPEALTW
ncbi:hypothetical protein MC7420_7384 [Coleofasciculus chthonoplastes PCC 7420]|uniref:Uncharacterized protein n=1 Tax=Coleofasciculus chthonoplastes PCC 7420 TaxID=118168 RepID=B4VHY6_9CYAN|nr:hypothetical protein [Coleofasciculus chthonoplastes]EDX78731.1 hypothetical protein MC7420_7384 [Coleofasciculus chthonoplastes PCC 7420]